MKKLILSLLIVTATLPALAQSTSGIREFTVTDVGKVVRIDITAFDSSKKVHLIRKSSIVSLRYLQDQGQYWIVVKTTSGEGDPLIYKFNADASIKAKKLFDELSKLTLLAP